MPKAKKTILCFPYWDISFSCATLFFTVINSSCAISHRNTNKIKPPLGISWISWTATSRHQLIDHSGNWRGRTRDRNNGEISSEWPILRSYLGKIIVCPRLHGCETRNPRESYQNMSTIICWFSWHYYRLPGFNYMSGILFLSFEFQLCKFECPNSFENYIYVVYGRRRMLSRLYIVMLMTFVTWYTAKDYRSIGTKLKRQWRHCSYAARLRNSKLFYINTSY